MGDKDAERAKELRKLAAGSIVRDDRETGDALVKAAEAVEAAKKGKKN